MIYELDGVSPDIADDVFVAPDANVIGRVRIGTKSLGLVWKHDPG